MFFRFFFSRMSLPKQVSYVQKKGIMLGTRVKDSRRIHIYMINDLFVEVTYKDDNIDHEGESLTMVRGLENLNEYLEKEFKASF
jgi:hypothetical protein